MKKWDPRTFSQNTVSALFASFKKKNAQFRSYFGLISDIQNNNFAN